MANSRFLRPGDNVKFINDKRYKDKVFTVKEGPVLFDRYLAAKLKGIRGYHNIKNLEIIE